MTKYHTNRNFKQPQSLASSSYKFYSNRGNWYKNRLTDLTGQNIPLDWDVFGITGFGKLPDCSQNLQLFSQGDHAMRPKGYSSFSSLIE